VSELQPTVKPSPNVGWRLLYFFVLVGLLGCALLWGSLRFSVGDGLCSETPSPDGTATLLLRNSCYLLHCDFEVSLRQGTFERSLGRIDDGETDCEVPVQWTWHEHSVEYWFPGRNGVRQGEIQF
jgi:hypothetical protein